MRMHNPVSQKGNRKNSIFFLKNPFLGYVSNENTYCVSTSHIPHPYFKHKGHMYYTSGSH